MDIQSGIEFMEKRVGAAKRALARKAANRGQRPYMRNGKPVKGHGEQDGTAAVHPAGELFPKFSKEEYDTDVGDGKFSDETMRNVVAENTADDFESAVRYKLNDPNGPASVDYDSMVEFVRWLETERKRMNAMKEQVSDPKIRAKLSIAVRAAWQYHTKYGNKLLRAGIDWRK